MTTKELLEKLLRSYTRYYDIETENVTEGFAAEACFHSHDEQYFLLKSAKLAEADSHEYVFFALETGLTPQKVQKYVEKAWETGMSRVTPTSSHQSSDVAVIIIADSIPKDAARTVKRTRLFKSYRHGLQGFSHLRLCAFDLSSGKGCCNRFGSSLLKPFKNLL